MKDIDWNKLVIIDKIMDYFYEALEVPEVAAPVVSEVAKEVPEVAAPEVPEVAKDILRGNVQMTLQETYSFKYSSLVMCMAVSMY
nr:hypothetical protein [Tanacetum cinerariifolium]